MLILYHVLQGAKPTIHLVVGILDAPSFITNAKYLHSSCVCFKNYDQCGRTYHNYSISGCQHIVCYCQTLKDGTTTWLHHLFKVCTDEIQRELLRWMHLQCSDQTVEQGRSSKVMITSSSFMYTFKHVSRSTRKFTFLM